MNKSEAIRAAIKTNAYEVSPHILAYPGGHVFFDDAGSAQEFTLQKAVFGLLREGLTPSSFRLQVARARDVALRELRMISADLILVSESFVKKHPVCILRSTAEDGRIEDGRIFGMSMRSAKSLYLGAYFMIMDCPEGGIPCKAKPEEDTKSGSTLLDAMKGVDRNVV